MKDDSKATDHISQQLQEMGSIPVIPENGSPFVAAGGDMIPPANMLNS
jgi:hypothetical protein